MKFVDTAVSAPENTILAADDYTAIPFVVTESAAVKAGYPMTKAGKKGAVSGEGSTLATTADGILLHDVDPKVNPNGSLLVRGVVDQKKANASSGFTFDANAVKALRAAVPGVVLRDDIGPNG